MSVNKEWFQGQQVELTDLNKDERSRLRPIVGAVIAASFLGALLLWSVKAFAEEIPVHVYAPLRAALGVAKLQAQVQALRLATTDIPVHVHEQDGLTIRLMPGPCVERNSTLMISAGAPEYLERLKAIESVWRMKDGTNKPFAGCWLELSKAETGGEDVFVLIFEDGDRYVIPKSQFGKNAGTGA